MDGVEDAAAIQFQNEVQGYTHHYSTLNALKQGRLAAERRETQEKIEKLFDDKVTRKQQKLQLHHNLAMKRQKPKLRAVQSAVQLSPEPEFKKTTFKYENILISNLIS